MQFKIFIACLFAAMSSANEVDPADDSAAYMTVVTPHFKVEVMVKCPETSIFCISLLPEFNPIIINALDIITNTLYTPQGLSPATDFRGSIPKTTSIAIRFVYSEEPGWVGKTDRFKSRDDHHRTINLKLSDFERLNVTWMDHARLLDYLAYVMTHELVHCYQHYYPLPSSNIFVKHWDVWKNVWKWVNGKKRSIQVWHTPVGLIEGIAEFVVLESNLKAKSWAVLSRIPINSSQLTYDWDKGYVYTANFLIFLEHVWVGPGAVARINDRLLQKGYTEKELQDPNFCTTDKGFWEDLFGNTIDVLWHEYGLYLDGMGQSPWTQSKEIKPDKKCWNKRGFFLTAIIFSLTLGPVLELFGVPTDEEREAAEEAKRQVILKNVKSLRTLIAPRGE
ncbi:hypothetical protein N7495_002092 [Penicillium taxi]|uniref:uncharacterized protein n=1 Tax=Penicillium taxi TaxID=168475 RepID=UPI002545B449|nr:uncharacterized protein N7495_002092 [Penicillium taxi]KAJ5901564.1 hypothetical protein N7495_002092 [Penicillium taxi]